MANTTAAGFTTISEFAPDTMRAILDGAPVEVDPTGERPWIRSSDTAP
jgi:hypothetical protein